MPKYKESNYSKKLRDPRWQKKRLEIMERDEFSCRMCGDNSSTLNVHHCYYDNKEPWAYESSSLITLCEECHKSESAAKIDKNALINIMSSKGMMSHHFNEIVCAIDESKIYQFDDYYISALAWSINNEAARGKVHFQ